MLIPAAVLAMGRRGPRWADWVRILPATAAELIGRWKLSPDGRGTHGHCSLVLPVRTVDGLAAVLKLGFPDEDSEHEHLALRRWDGNGAVRLLSADPHHGALLLERLSDRALTSEPDLQACAVVAGLYGRLHVAPLPKVRPLSALVERWTAGLRRLPRSAPIPHRLVDQAITLGFELTADGPGRDRLLHTDLHYANVLGANVLGADALGADALGANALGANALGAAPEPWLAIDPKPVNGDPHYELAPMLWNRFTELAGDVRSGVRTRFWTLVEAAGFDEDRARAWVVVRMVHNAMWELQGPNIDRHWLTVCIAVAKAVQG